MIGAKSHVSSLPELLAAAADTKTRDIVVRSKIVEAPTFRLSPGQRLSGAGEESVLHFTHGQDGVQLSTDNQINNLQLITDPDKRAIFNDTSVAQLGRLLLSDLRVCGVVQLLAREQVRGGHVEV